ncbi:hypothetical protein ES705_47109 [subsurface metagenome]
MANEVFTGYVVDNYDAYFAAIDNFSTALTPTVAKVDAAIKAVNTKVTEEAAVAAVNEAKTPAELNAALANEVFEGYVVANYDAYFAEVGTGLQFPGDLADVAAVDAAIKAVNAAEADHVSMELICDTPEFTATEPDLFEVDIVANDDKGKIVKLYITLPDELFAGDEATPPPTVGTIDFISVDPLTGDLVTIPLYGDLGPDGASTDYVNIIGPDDGFPLINETVYFKVLLQPEAVGIHIVEVEVKTYSAIPGYVPKTLYEDSIFVKVVGK